MAWIVLTADDVARRLAAAELTALTSAAKKAEQTPEEILAKAIASVVVKVRGYVAGCKTNKLGESGTIPDELEGDALALIRDYLFTRLPGMAQLYDELRQNETERAIATLKDAARCLVGIVPPETPAPDNEQAAGPAVQLVSSRKRIASRDQTAGLL